MIQRTLTNLGHLWLLSLLGLGALGGAQEANPTTSVPPQPAGAVAPVEPQPAPMQSNAVPIPPAGLQGTSLLPSATGAAKPEAREKLAKVLGILIAYPGLKLQVDGNTDNIGSDEYNQKLSEQRAGGVRDYLVSQSVAEAIVTAQGCGKSDRVADISTNDGRAHNRRVELVVSGAAIGIEPSAPGAQSQNLPATQPSQISPAGSASNQQASDNSSLAGASSPPQ